MYIALYCGVADASVVVSVDASNAAVTANTSVTVTVASGAAISTAGDVFSSYQKLLIFAAV